MDDWFPVRRHKRRGRSDRGYTFTSEAIGPSMRSSQPYSFINSLLHQHLVRIHREDHDTVYRGERQPGEPAVLVVGSPLQGDSDYAGDSESDAESEELSTATSKRASSPAEQLSDPETPRRPVTYSKRDQKRADALRLVRAHQTAEAKRVARKKRAHVSPSRRSRRLRRGRLGDSSDFGVLTTDIVADMDFVVHAFNDHRPRPLIDRHNYVMVVVVGAPKGEQTWWREVIRSAEQDIGRLNRNGDFSHLGEDESSVRFGIGFGEDFTGPHQICNNDANTEELSLIELSEAFKAISGYQNHIYQQFAPGGYAIVASKVGELIKREIVFPSFAHSVFTTSQISFCDAPTIAEKNEDAAYDTMEAITSFGNYDYKKGGQLVSWDDKAVIEVPPGATVLLPTGTKRYSFMAVAPSERRYLFRQYCNAGALRWVEKGGHSDREWENILSEEELDAWKGKRVELGAASLKSFSKIGDIYVL